MQINKTAKWAYLLLAFFVGLTACKKDTDLILSPDELIIGAYLKLDSTINTTVNQSNLNAPVAIIVSGYGEEITKVTVFASTNNTTNKSTWRKVKEFNMDASQKVTLSVTPAEIATALGTPIANGATYNLYNEVTTKSGKTYSLANTNTDLATAPDYKVGLRWQAKVPCAYDQSVFTGNFTVITDTWQDYSPGALVSVQPGPGANQITIFVYPSPDYGTNRRGVIVSVNPVDQSATVAEQIVGDYYNGSGGLDPDVTMRSTSGSVNSCTKTIQINSITFRYLGANYPGYRLELRKL